MRICVHQISLTLLILIAGLLFTSCGWKKNISSTAPVKGLNRIAILPMDRASTKPAGERPTCNISDTYSTGIYTIPIDAVETGTNYLHSIFSMDSRFFPITEGKCLGFLNSALATDINRSQLKIIQMYGTELNADAVLYGKIHRYRDRVGNDYSVATPASTAFTLTLIRVKDGATLWRYSFDETQQALTENLFNFKLYRRKGMRWLTAGELMEYGLKLGQEDLEKRMLIDNED